MGTDSVLLGAWAATEGAERILDIGTGTGVVALFLAQRTEEQAAVSITAVEIDPDAARCAAANFAASPWAGRLEIKQGAVQEFATASGRQFDLIVSNPPFYTETVVSPDARRRLGRNTVELTQEDLLQAVCRLLAPGGAFCAILPEKEGRRLCELAVTKGLYCSAETRVSARPGMPVERLLLRFTRDPRPFQREDLAIYSRLEEYSPEFQRMTGDFYVHGTFKVS